MCLSLLACEVSAVALCSLPLMGTLMMSSLTTSFGSRFTFLAALERTPSPLLVGWVESIVYRRVCRGCTVTSLLLVCCCSS